MNNFRHHDDEFLEHLRSYEQASRSSLLSRTPVIVRITGKNPLKLLGVFKQFDWSYIECMEAAARRLVIEAQNCKLAYVQSNEISLLLIDFKSQHTSSWFKNDVQKMCSSAASIATAAFYEEFFRQKRSLYDAGLSQSFNVNCFNITLADVGNYFSWRRSDCERNSVTLLANENLSHEDIMGLNRTQLIDLLKIKKGVEWNKMHPTFKHGFIITKERVEGLENGTLRERWTKLDAPTFKENDFFKNLLRLEESV